MMTGIFAAAAMLLLILDARTAAAGAKAGIELCLGTVVPSLLPFFILSMLLTSSLLGRGGRLMRPLGKFCGMPGGSESLLVVGLLGGYPVGAQNISQAKDSGSLSEEDSRILLGFCNNAGPAFIFGIAGCQFSQKWMGWLLWGIHILSALLTARVLRRPHTGAASVVPRTPLSLSEALEKALRVMASVCGWVVLFRVVIAFLEKWLLWRAPETDKVLCSGLLELSNGCLMLGSIENTGLRMILCSLFLAFGGLCVTMQTISVTPGIRRTNYFLGKLCQTAFSGSFACCAQFWLLPEDQRMDIPLWIPALLCLIPLLIKIAVAFPGKMVYNRVKSEKTRCGPCCSEKISPAAARTASEARSLTRIPSSAPKRAS